ncbi:MAG TPA: hypothetical protein VHN37_03185 [Actinomycetota bacterium]|nr:hypothetical protein [Actinomycetota bacterium]
MKIVRLVASCAAVMLLVTACGGDDGEDSAAGPTPAAEETAAADYSAFCDAVVEAETAVLAASSGGDPSGIEDLVETVEENAPPELEEQVAVVTDTVREALRTQDDRAFEGDEFSESEEEVDRWVVDNCGYDEVPVTAVDYAFEGVPETMPAGNTAFVFSNEGEEVHEMIMVRYKDPSTTIEDLMKLSDQEAQQVLDFLGASFGPPGATDTEVKQLTPGKYALVCFVPVGSTSPKAARKADGPPHVARGMSAEFTVE